MENPNPTVFTAPLAVIKIANKTVGKIRNLTFTEQVQRGEVMGIGNLTLQEVPIIAIRCSFTADSYMIDLRKLGTIEDPFWPVKATDPKVLINTLLLGEQPTQIHVYRKKATSIANGLVTSASEDSYETIGIAQDCYLDSRSWNIQENNISGKNLSGRYLTPIYNLGF